MIILYLYSILKTHTQTHGYTAHMKNTLLSQFYIYHGEGKTSLVPSNRSSLTHVRGSLGGADFSPISSRGSWNTSWELEQEVIQFLDAQFPGKLWSFRKLEMIVTPGYRWLQIPLIPIPIFFFLGGRGVSIPNNPKLVVPPGASLLDQENSFIVLLYFLHWRTPRLPWLSRSVCC